MTQMKKKMRTLAEAKYGRTLTHLEWYKVQFVAGYNNNTLKHMTKEDIHTAIMRDDLVVKTQYY